MANGCFSAATSNYQGTIKLNCKVQELWRQHENHKSGENYKAPKIIRLREPFGKIGNLLLVLWILLLTLSLNLFNIFICQIGNV